MMRAARIWTTVAIVAAVLATNTTLAADSALATSTPEVREQLAAVARGQIAAFNAGDFAGALRFASERFRAQFDVARFEKLVRENYPVIVSATSTSILAARDNGRDATLDVRVTGSDGATGYFRYLLTRENDAWVILGVVPIAAPPPPVQA